jgi:nucleoid-associated protein YgaU
LLVSVDNVNANADAVPHHDTAIGTWHVESGDDFWRMAERILTDAYGRAPTAREHGAYWAQLVAANDDRLAQPHNANAIFPGQDFVVVMPALTPDHPSLFVDFAPMSEAP